MKKLLYLFFAISLFSCSSDDDSNQTFLERYADIVWEGTGSGGLRCSFNLNGFTQKNEECFVYIWGIENSNTGNTWNLLENNYDYFVINKEIDGTIDFTSTITISEDENTITEYIVEEEIFTAVRTSLSNPCN